MVIDKMQKMNLWPRRVFSAEELSSGVGLGGVWRKRTVSLPPQWGISTGKTFI